MGVHMPPSPMPYQASRGGGRSRHGRTLWNGIAAPAAVVQPQRRQRHAESAARTSEWRCRAQAPRCRCARAARHRPPPIGGQDPPSGNRLKGGSAGWGLETEDRVVCGEYLALLDYKLDRREELERKVEALIVEPAYREAVGCLCGLKVISTQAAMVPVTKIGDFRRFEHPCKLMAYVGLVPSGHSSS